MHLKSILASYNILQTLRILSKRALISHKMSTNELKDTTAKLIVAVSQMNATNNKEANLQKVHELVKRAKEKNAKFLFLPECCDFVGENRQQTLNLSEPLNGATVNAYKELAKKYQIWLSLGGLHESILNEKYEKSEKIYNSNIVIDSDGNIVDIYRKLHLFDVDVPNLRLVESDVVKKGEQIVSPVKTPIGMVGLQICYDMRFPEVSRVLRNLGADIICYPSAFTYKTGKVHWEILLRARAIENQCYVIAPAQVGFHNPNRQSYGHAMIIDPWGEIVAHIREEELEVATAEIDLKKISSIREGMPCFNHRRTDVCTLTSIDTCTIEEVNRHFGSHVIPKETIFFESPLSFAFTNLRCVLPGHVLVSTKRLAPRLKDLNHEEIADLFTTACEIQRMLDDMYKTTSATVTIQDGPDAGQTIEHVHCHVIPRRQGDFFPNDEIYVRLENLPLECKNRQLDDMISEASIYRNYFSKKHPRFQNMHVKAEEKKI